MYTCIQEGLLLFAVAVITSKEHNLLVVSKKIVLIYLDFKALSCMFVLGVAILDNLTSTYLTVLNRIF